MKDLKTEGKRLFCAVITGSLVLFSLSVIALQAPADKMTLKQLRKTVKQSDFNDFPIDVNREVLTELNRFLSNRKWREFSRNSLKRYKRYKKMIESKASRYGLPSELAAVAFIETGFKNIPDRRTSISSTGAGMWQFIPRTARRYGLVVNEHKDERLNVSLATDAAMRYLGDNHLKLNDARLALMGYYFGENRVLHDIARYGTRDPWMLIEEARYKTPYLARVMAAAILMKYPSLIL